MYLLNISLEMGGAKNKNMKKMTVLDRVPTDDELKETIAEMEQGIEFMKKLLKLNDAGREQALIYMFGLMHFTKYREITGNYRNKMCFRKEMQK